jgi:hypothetical protein
MSAADCTCGWSWSDNPGSHYDWCPKRTPETPWSFLPVKPCFHQTPVIPCFKDGQIVCGECEFGYVAEKP